MSDPQYFTVTGTATNQGFMMRVQAASADEASAYVVSFMQSKGSTNVVITSVVPG